MPSAISVAMKPGKRVPDTAMLARKKLARDRGELYLEYGLRSDENGDLANARSYCEEGLELNNGPFYLCVREQLEDLLMKVKAMHSVWLVNSGQI